MARQKKCDLCNTPYLREKHSIENYIITIDRCKCGWKLFDVKDTEGKSLKDVLEKEVLERMLKSKASSLKF